MELIVLLKMLRDDRRHRIASVGICGCVHMMLDDSVDKKESLTIIKRLKYLISIWPECGKDKECPINGGLLEYCRATEMGIMWDETTEYGAARWRLLHWLIAELEREDGTIT